MYRLTVSDVQSVERREACVPDGLQFNVADNQTTDMNARGQTWSVRAFSHVYIRDFKLGKLVTGKRSVRSKPADSCFVF